VESSRQDASWYAVTILLLPTQQRQPMQQLVLRPWRCSSCIITTTYPEVRRVIKKKLLSPCPITHRSNSTHSSNKNHFACVRSALSAGPIPYEKGWAWQHVLLNRRLNYMRMQEKLETASSDGNHVEQEDKDWILMFEHQPVYTLGRGATEDYLTFLNNEPDGGLEKRKRLDRKYRGEDASRLNIDRFQQHTKSGSTTDISTSEQEEVDELSNQSMCKSQPVLSPNGSPIYRIERGGEVTYHGPGQLVMYPLLNLKHPNYQQDLHWYLRQIEEVIIQTLLHFDIKSNRDDINTGVWVGQNKIAAVGVSATKWITTHGLALNVSPNLEHFDKDIITPCGIEERGVTSISEVLRGASSSSSSDLCPPSLNEVADVALKCFGEVFDVDVTEGCAIR
jgi:lipoate-protein ligase B